MESHVTVILSLFLIVFSYFIKKYMEIKNVVNTIKFVVKSPFFRFMLLLVFFSLFYIIFGPKMA